MIELRGNSYSTRNEVILTVNSPLVEEIVNEYSPFSFSASERTIISPESPSI